MVKEIISDNNTKYGVSPSGKASDFDSAIRRFEPYHPRNKIVFMNFNCNEFDNS